MIFQQCPVCGRYMIPNMSETSGWYQCVCGYDSRSYVYTYTNHSSDFGYGEKERRTTRLIDADALIERMYHDAFESDTDMQKWDGGCWIRYKMFENAMDSAPIVEERKKGKWKYGNGNGECPFCGRERPLSWDNFCGFCGADMRGE